MHGTGCDSCDSCDNRIEAIKERAAIMEFDGGLDRDSAQRAAKLLHSGALDPRTCVHRPQKKEGPRG